MSDDKILKLAAAHCVLGERTSRVFDFTEIGILAFARAVRASTSNSSAMPEFFRLLEAYENVVLAWTTKDGNTEILPARDALRDFVAKLATPPVPDARAVAEAANVRTAVRDAIADTIGDAYDCTRVWSAWGVGTMSSDDFTPIVDSEERLFEIADAAIVAIAAANKDNNNV